LAPGGEATPSGQPASYSGAQKGHDPGGPPALSYRAKRPALGPRPAVPGRLAARNRY